MVDLKQAKGGVCWCVAGGLNQLSVRGHIKKNL